MTLCKCGCGKEIIIKPYHKYYGIPKYIWGHNHSNLGKIFSDNYRNKLSEAHKGKYHSEETKKKMAESQRKRNHGGKNNCNWGKRQSDETRRKRSESMKKILRHGSDNPNWNGGTSFLPYCSKFNYKLKEQIRNRDNRICQKCGKIENGRRHSVHHIHYDKENCYPDLITLCISCNGKVNTNKDYWEEHFMNILKERNLLNYFENLEGEE